MVEPSASLLACKLARLQRALEMMWRRARTEDLKSDMAPKSNAGVKDLKRGAVFAFLSSAAFVAMLLERP